MYHIYEADSIQWMRDYHAEQFDVIVTDPPYAIDHYNAKWDTHKSNQAYREWTELWSVAAFDIVKPGAYMLAFGAARTFGHQQVAFENVGWETCDVLGWLYGQGFPHYAKVDGGEGHTVYTAALKPAYEPVLLMRKPLMGTYQQNFNEYGTGVLDIDNARGIDDRWPSNIIADDVTIEVLGDVPAFYYHAKVSRAERESGLEDLDAVILSDGRTKAINNPYQRNREVKNNHPAVKPIGVMQWLIKLVNGTNKRILDPFVGSGTTIIAAELAGATLSVGIDADSRYCDIAGKRCEFWINAERQRVLL